MKKYILLTVLFINALYGYGQILDGTMQITGDFNMSQLIDELVKEGGLDDKTSGFESNFDATLISFVLNPTGSTATGVTTSEQNCEENVYRYEMFIHRSYNLDFEKTIIEARTYENSGFRFPEVSTYDEMDPTLQLFGPRNLYPENGSQYIQIPDDATQAIKIMEFIGCRTDIPIQFKIKPSTLSPSGNSDIIIYYTIVGNMM
jgi:hypothetical protein